MRNKKRPLNTLLTNDQIGVRRPGNTGSWYITRENLREDTLSDINLEPKVVVLDQVGDVINLTIELVQEYNEKNVSEQKAFYAYLASDVDGEVLAATAPNGGWEKGAEGTIINLVANKAGLFLTNEDGLIDIAIEHSLTATYYLVMVMPTGVVYGPIAVAFDEGSP